MFRKAGSLLRDAFSLAVYGETTGDIARKHEVAEKLMAKSLPLKPDAEQPSVDNSYEDRLREVLMVTKTKDLQTFLDNDVAVCLDTRIYNQKDGWHREIFGVYYNEGKGGVAALWDSGKTSENSRFFERSAFSHGGTTLNALATLIRDGGVSGNDERYYAARRSQNFGTYTKFYTDWRSEANFSKGAVNKNPELKEPPKRRGSAPAA